MQKRKWSRGEILALLAVVVTLIGVIAAAMVVPEVRSWLRLDKPSAVLSASPKSDGSAAERVVPEPQKNSAANRISAVETNLHIVQKSDDKNSSALPPEPRQREPMAAIINAPSAPNGFAITGGTVDHPTINNFGPPEPNLTWHQELRAGDLAVMFTLDHSMEVPAFLVECDQPCWTVTATTAGTTVPKPAWNVGGDPKKTGVILLQPRPLGAGLEVTMIIRSQNTASDRPVRAMSIAKMQQSMVDTLSRF